MVKIKWLAHAAFLIEGDGRRITPGPKFFILPVTELTGYFPDESVKWLDNSEIELSRDALPNETQIYVLQPTLVGEPG